MFILVDRQIDLGDWYAIVTAVLLIFTVIANPEGIVGPAHAKIGARRLARLALGRTGRAVGRRTDRRRASTSSTPMRPAPCGSTRVTVRYGGVVAVTTCPSTFHARRDRRAHRTERRRQDHVLDAITGFAAATGEVTHR